MKREAASIAIRLDEEIGVFREFLQLLQQEQAALIQGETEGLLQLSSHKAQLIEQLGVFAVERNRSLSAAGCDDNAAGVAKWLDAIGADAKTRDLWKDLLQLAKEAEQVNRNNGALIETHMQHNQQALAVLRAAANPGSIYGPSGQISGPAGVTSRDKA